MKEVSRSGAVVAGGRESARRAKNHTSKRCSICSGRLKSGSVPLMEPEGVTPLRLRIAMGIVASERWPESYSSYRSILNDRKWILFIAWGFVVAMIFHLVLIVMIAMVAK
ncbi:MAG: hypothetical protein E6J48_06370 [Chloroflexi bacterium]|nr:MAG: hypothetical protein E6J48_06370 [Chloroflexota bacterium]